MTTLEKNKVIFLDIDGVLNSEKWALTYKYGGVSLPEHKGNVERYIKDARLDPSAVNLLNELCKETKAKIVISSSWRLDEIGKTVEYWNVLFKGILGKIGKECFIDVIAITPTQRERLSDSRWIEIEMWLKENPVDGFCILDDSYATMSQLDWSKEHYVQTNNLDGFTIDDFRECRSILLKELR
jgi:hypothetical protein